MPTRQDGKVENNSSTFARLTRLRITTVPSTSTPWTWNADFAISRPIVLTSPMDGSPQCGLLSRNHPMALRCRRVGAVHSIKLEKNSVRAYVFRFALECGHLRRAKQRTCLQQKANS